MSTSLLQVVYDFQVVCVTYQNEFCFFSFTDTISGRNSNSIRPLVEVSWKPDGVIRYLFHFAGTTAGEVVTYRVGQYGRSGWIFWRLSRKNTNYIWWGTGWHKRYCSYICNSLSRTPVFPEDPCPQPQWNWVQLALLELSTCTCICIN